MFWKKFFWMLVSVSSLIGSNYFEQPLLMVGFYLGLIMWFRADVFHLSFDATLAAIKHYEDSATDIDEATEMAEADDELATLDSATFLARLKSMDDYS